MEVAKMRFNMSACLSICLHKTTQELLDGFSNLLQGNERKVTFTTTIGDNNK
jgi:hypothetical protein